MVYGCGTPSTVGYSGLTSNNCQSSCSVQGGSQGSSCAQIGKTFVCYCRQEYTNYTRSCGTCNSQGSWGNWQTTPIEQDTCSIVVGTRTTIGQ